jgi:hypothetical protein
MVTIGKKKKKKKMVKVTMYYQQLYNSATEQTYNTFLSSRSYGNKILQFLDARKSNALTAPTFAPIYSPPPPFTFLHEGR